ncbi:MAG: hypothetical protein IPN66_07760 [Candidatus Competibacteraceae bacterium]|nr:hypothetical protein [Candidatus Competibacteraceae bacterium]MBK8897105.1 hypothetical protein [Candidatus Competibacteraceae bacterium]
MMNIRLLICSLLLQIPLVVEALPAFPGASGAGAISVGGRGGVIYEVTNLNGGGPGSLRAGVEMSGPRIIVFRVGGTIEIEHTLHISNPYITIAGQTAPGGGITISGKNTVGDVFNISTHDVIIRYVRFRKGYNSGTVSQDGDAFSFFGVASTSVIDHCSMSWAQDENAQVWGNSSGPQPHDITYSWSIFAEPLAKHPTNLITGSNANASQNMLNIDAHHGFFANSFYRNPLIKNKSFRLVNNIIYNWSLSATELGGGVQADIIGNLYKPGPMYLSAENRRLYEIQAFVAPNDTTPSGNPSVYVAGNMGPHNSNPESDNWGMVREVTTEGNPEIGPLSATYRRSVPLAALPVPIEAQPANQLEALLFPTVGASQRLDCLGNWVFNRDTVDARLVQEYQTGKGIVPNTESDVGGFPVISNGTPCTDTDHDGMPDQWEDAKGLNKNDPSDGPRVGADGYTYVEKYLGGSSPAEMRLSSPKNVRFLP